MIFKCPKCGSTDIEFTVKNVPITFDIDKYGDYHYYTYNLDDEVYMSLMEGNADCHCYDCHELFDIGEAVKEDD